MAARLFGVLDKVAQVAAPSGEKDPDAAEFEESTVNRAADLGVKLAGAFDHALGVAAEKLKRDVASEPEDAGEAED